MAGNSIGSIFRVTTWGESHGPAIGAVIDGCPAGLRIDEEYIARQLSRRRPGHSDLTSPRRETDECAILSGVFEGYTTGTPISLYILNNNQRPGDYDALRDVYRPSHADYSYDARYGRRDHRGGGRSSARETAARVAAGAVAQLLLREMGVVLQSYVTSIGPIRLDIPLEQLDPEAALHSPVGCPHPHTAQRMAELIELVRAEGDSVGGTVRCLARGVPAGWGDPVFDRLEADLGKAMLSVNAVKGVSFGAGFDAARGRGSEFNDAFVVSDGNLTTSTNHSGGIQGGISNGQDIVVDIAFKPVASIARGQSTVDSQGNPVELAVQGRHDPCVVPRALPIVEAMAALVLADHGLRRRSARLG
jgi:chorismate synthase